MTITITLEKFITDMLTVVDQVISSFVESGFRNLVSSNTTTITLLMTVYVIWIGYRFLSHTSDKDILSITKHLVMLVLVYALLMDWHLFCLFFYDIFTTEPALITKTMLSSNSGHIGFQANSTAEALNTIFAQGIKTTSTIWQHAGLNPVLYLCGFLVFLSTCVNCLYALGLLVYAKLAMAVILFLAPLFICCLLWLSTRKLFDSWLQSLINYAFIPIVTCGFLMLTLSLAQAILPGVNQEATGGNTHFTGVLVYFGVAVLNFFLLRQIPNICAGLTASFALEALHSAMPLAKQAFRTSVAAPVFSKAGNYAKSKYKQAKAGIRESKAKQN